MGVRAETKVLDSLTRVLGTTQEKGVGASREASSNFVNSKNLTASLLDAGTGRGRESKGGNRELGELQETVIIGDGSDLFYVQCCALDHFAGFLQ